MDVNEPERRHMPPQDKLTIYAAVKAAAEELSGTNSLIGHFSVHRDALMLIVELICRKLEDSAEDLEAFAGHAKRNNINVEDVKLLFRKNAKILEGLKSIEDAEEKEKPPVKRKRGETADADPS